ncbi:MAG: hypothetical protein OES24_02925 [Acidimicrobiia bacterium]|nr:hypothetical protein [Acidimicrobiia bacterium]
MLISDLTLLVSLAGFCVAWLWTGTAGRNAVLWATATVGLVSGAWGVIDGRWQAGLGTAVAVVFLATIAVGTRRERVAEQRVPLLSGMTFIALAVLSFGLLYSLPSFRSPSPTDPTTWESGTSS